MWVILRADAPGYYLPALRAYGTAYGLTPREIALMWQTAPPRMPVAGP